MATNKSQYTLTTQWIVPEEKTSEVENFFAEHEVYVTEQGGMKHVELWQSHPAAEKMAGMAEYQTEMSFNAEVIASMES